MRSPLIASSYVPGKAYGPEVVELWLAHLRGPGGHRGDTLLFTDSPEALARLDVRTAPFGGPAATPAELFLRRVRNGLRIEAEGHTAIVQMDLDMLAIAPLEGFFPRDGALWAAASGLDLFERRHLGYFFPRGWRRRWEALRAGLRRRRRPPVSACLVAARGDRWRGHLERWCAAIEQAAAAVPEAPPPLGDQTVLNLVHHRGWIPVRAFPESWIQHRGWAPGPETRVLHFAGVPDRLAAMRRFAVVGAGGTA